MPQAVILCSSILMHLCHAIAAIRLVLPYSKNGNSMQDALCNGCCRSFLLLLQVSPCTALLSDQASICMGRHRCSTFWKALPQAYLKTFLPTAHERSCAEPPWCLMTLLLAERQLPQQMSLYSLASCTDMMCKRLGSISSPAMKVVSLPAKMSHLWRGRLSQQVGLIAKD